MKLFIWNSPYGIDYGGCCLYVLAPNLKEARRIAKEKCTDAAFGLSWRDPTKMDVDNIKPTRIISETYAELYSWEE